MKTFFRNVDKLLLGSITVIFLLLISVLCWIFNSNDTIPMWLYIITMICCYLCCIIIYAVCKSNKNEVVYRLPKIRSINKLNSKYVFVVERNDLFSQGSYATICYQDGDDSIELVLGLGYVQSITSAGYLQIELETESIDESASKILKKITDNSFYRSTIKIKPSTNKELIKEALING